MSRTTQDVARQWLWRHSLNELQRTRDLARWRTLRKEVSAWKWVDRRMVRVLDALRPTRKERRAWRELARLAAKHHADALRPLPKSERPLCGARTRSGGSCKAKVCPRPDGQGMATRCRLHGGLSTGASQEGRAAIVRSNQTRQAPTKYGPDVCAKVCQGLARGGSVARSCKAAGISVQTFYNWQEKHPDFAAAVGEARPVPEGDVYAMLGIPRGLANKLKKMEERTRG